MSVNSVISIRLSGCLLNPDDRLATVQFCLHCLAGVEVVVPCPGCARVVFCSEKCRQAGSPAHSYQCQLDLYALRDEDTKDGFSVFR